MASSNSSRTTSLAWWNRPWTPFLLWVPFLEKHSVFGAIVDPIRFKRERRQYRLAYSIGNMDIINQLTDANPETGSGSMRATMARIIKSRGRNLLYLMFNMIFLIDIAYNCCVYGLVSQERDPITGQYKHFWPRFQNTHHLIDYLEPFQHSEGINQLYLMVMLSQMFIKFCGCRELIMSERINHIRYQKINCIQFGLVWLANTRVTTRQWLEFFLYAWHHQCDLQSERARDQLQRMMRLNKLIRHLPHLDRFYYHNLIDFELCYEQSCIRFRARKGSRNFSNKNSPRHIALKDGFLPRPHPRLDPKEMAALIFLAISGIFSILLVACSTYALFIYQNTVMPGRGFLDLLYCYWAGLMVVYVLASNVCYLALMVSKTACYYSRTRRLNSLLLLLYDRFLSLQMVKLYKEHQLIISGLWYRPELASTQRRLRTNDENVKTSIHSWQYLDIPGTSMEELNGQTMELRPPSVETAARSSPLELELNDNGSLVKLLDELGFLMDLVQLVRVEFGDMRHMFTTQVNIYFIFGTLMLSFSTHLLIDSRELSEIHVIVCTYMIVMMPMIVGLILGASAEAVNRNLARILKLIMANCNSQLNQELRLQVQMNYSHLCDVNNRSIVILGSVPLSFGSLFSILTWIASVTLLIHTRTVR